MQHLYSSSTLLSNQLLLVPIFSFHGILLIMSGFTLSIVVTSDHVEIERTFCLFGSGAFRYVNYTGEMDLILGLSLALPIHILDIR